MNTPIATPTADAPVALAPVPETVDRTDARVGDRGSAAADSRLVLDDLLVEDVSIDGMCGVY